MAKVNWTFEALENLETIANYLEQYSSGLATATVDNIFKQAEYIARFPKIGRKVPEFNLDFVREVIYKNYRIVYHIIDKNRIDIIIVHHSSSPLKDIERLV